MAPLALAILWAPATALSILAGAAVCRGAQSAAESSHFELSTAEIFTRAMRCVVRPGRARFKVTPKEGVDHGGWQSLRQMRALLILATLLGLGLVLRVAEDLGAGFLPPMRGMAIWFVPLIGALELRRVLRTLLLVGTRRQLRMDYRTPLELSAQLSLGAAEQAAIGTAAAIGTRSAPAGAARPTASATDTSVVGADVLDADPAPRVSMPLLARVRDLSPSGIGFELATPLAIGATVELSLQLPTVRNLHPGPMRIHTEVRSCRQTRDGWRIGAEIRVCEEHDRRRIIEYCHVIWPYERLRGGIPPALQPATDGAEVAPPSAATRTAGSA
jgi:hypothetical protein